MLKVEKLTQEQYEKALKEHLEEDHMGLIRTIAREARPGENAYQVCARLDAEGRLFVPNTPEEK